MRRLLHFMDWPLRLKMAVLLVVASIVPLGIATFIDIRGARERLVANTANLLAARADQLADRIDTFHQGYEHSAGRISRLPNAAALCQARAQDIDRLKSDLRAVLDVWPASDSNIRGVAILDLSGKVRAATEDPLIGLDLSYHRYVQEARRGAAFTSDIYFAEPQAAGAATIAYVDPVLDADKKPVGIAVLWVHANALWDVMKASNQLAGSNSFAVLFDHQGIRIGHTYSDDIVFHPGGQLDPATVNALVAERRFGEKTRQLLEDVRAFPDQFERALAKSPDEEMFRGFAPVNQKWNYGVARRFKTVPWTVFYMVPEESLNAQIATMTRQETLFAGVIILIALLAGSFFAAVILKPIGALSTATHLIAGGDLAARVRSGHADELGRLGTSFNAMAEQIEAQATALQTVYGDLELRIQERTAALVQTTRDLEVEVAERKRAELVAARLAAIVEYSSDAIVGKDLQSKVTSWNAGAERLFGYAAAEMLGQPITLLIPTDRQDDEERILKRISRGERVEPFETVRVRKDGGLIDVSVTVSPIKDATGEIVGASKVARDISERKRAEASLRDTQARLNSTLAAGSIGTWSWDIVNDRLVADEFTARMFSIEADVAAKGPPAEVYLQVISEEDRPHVEDALARAIQSCGSYDIEYRVRQGDGGFRWLQARGRVEGDAAGNATNFHGAVMDITARKQAEQALRVSEERLRTVTDNARVGLVMVNRERQYTFANATYAEILDLPSSDLVGQGVADVLATLYDEQIRPHLDRAFAGERVAYELRKPTANEDRCYAVRYEPTNVNGSVSQVVVVITDITERRHAEEALDAERNLLRMLIDLLPDYIYLKDTQSRFLACNEACAQLMGASSPAELTGKTDADFYPARMAAEFRADELAVLEGVSQVNKEEPFTRQDGTRESIVTTKLPLKDSSGRITGLVGYSRNVTAFRQAEQALRSSEGRYRALFECAPDGIVIADPQSYYIDANATICRMLGYTRDELIGLNASDIVTEIEVKHIGTALSELNAGSDYQREWQFQRQDGSVFAADVIAALMPDGNLLGVIRDITERKRAEEALRESEGRLRLSQQVARIGTFDWNIQTGVNQWTPELEAMYGLPPGGFSGTQQTWEELIYSEDRAEAVAQISLAMEGRNFEAEWRVIWPDGTVHWLAGRALVFRDETGQPLRLLGINLDITERRQAEEEVRRLNEDLEKRVAQRTSELKAVNKELEAFSYSVSHDLRAPLRHINGFSQALLEDYEDKLDEAGKGYLREVRGASQEMAQLIDDLLQLARVTRAEMHREPINLSEIARKVISDLRKDEKGRSVVVDIEEGLTTQGDKRLMQVMLINLLGNAWKFTSRQERAVIAFGQSKQNGQSIYFVRDNGAGFDMEYVGKLFGAFQRLHTTREFAGTGIGLATVQRIVHRHGGRVWAEGAVNQGATFYFTLANFKETANGEQSDLTG